MPENKRVLKIADITRSRSAGFSFVYSNHTEAAPAFNEISCLFCHIHRDLDGSPTAEQKVEVVMSWEHAARVRDLLDRMLRNYESEHGPVRSIQEPEGELSNSDEPGGE